MTTFIELIESSQINELYPKPDEFKTKHVAYGTAGFRTKLVDKKLIGFVTLFVKFYV